MRQRGSDRIGLLHDCVLLTKNPARPEKSQLCTSQKRPTIPPMKTLAGVSLAFLFFSTAFAQDASDKQLRSTTTSTTEEKTALDIFHLDGSYVWGSDIKTRDNYGEQDAIQSEFEYAHRFHLSGNLYLRTGVSYYRFDFGQTLAPLPLHLQSLSMPISVEYMVG